jgi:uncharacterized protein
MSGRLPQTVYPDRMADSGETLQGSMRVRSMSRLADFLHDTEGEVDVELLFGIDARRIRYVQGSLKTTLNLVCQRCLQPLAFPLAIEMKLGLVYSEASAQELQEAYDPLIMDQPRLDLWLLVEDELMLALPIVPMHAIGECGFDRELITAPGSGPTAASENETRRPFENLVDLMKERRW